MCSVWLQQGVENEAIGMSWGSDMLKQVVRELFKRGSSFCSTAQCTRVSVHPGLCMRGSMHPGRNANCIMLRSFSVWDHLAF